MTWAYVGMALFGVLPLIVKAIIVWRGRRALRAMDDATRARWDEAVRGP